MKKAVALLSVVALGAFALALAYAQATPGDFDPTWGEEGVVLTDFEGMDDTATTQVLMPDGKLVAAGWVNSYPGDFGAVRYLRDGRLDPSFGDGGRVVTAFSDDPELVDAAWGINARPNGGVHLFGETCDADYVVCQFAMAAYLADGSLDESFGAGGLVTTSIPDAETAISWPTRNILQPDGKVVAGGLALFENNQSDIVLLRYNSDGSLDETFGDGGISVIDFEGKAQFPQDIVALPGDKIMIVGGVADEFAFGAFFEEAFMARINSDGSVDTTFGGGDGYITWTLGGEPLGFDRALVTSESEMFIVGGDETDCTLQRFDLDGTLDTTFGDDGWVIIDSGLLDLCIDATLTADGRIALVGRASSAERASRTAAPGRSHDRLAARSAGTAESSPAAHQETFFDHIVGLYNTDGTPDATFGDNGLVRFTVDDGAGLFSNISAQQDGKLLVVGDALVGEQYDFGVVRFLGKGLPQGANPGALDPTWGDGGISYAGFEEADDYAFSQVMLPDGSLIAGGWANAYPGDFGAARFLPNGDLDPDFGDDGLVTTAFTEDPEAVDAAYGINSRPNGGFHLFGETCDADYVVCQLAAAAYLPDGSLDPSFGEDGRVVTDPGTASAASWSTRNVLQPDGKLVTAGIVYLDDGGTDLILIRYNEDGSLDDTFGDGGMVIQDFMGLDTYPQDLMALPGDELLATGSMIETNDEGDIVQIQSYIARFDSNGDLVTSFGGGDGYVLWDYNGEPHAAQRALLLPDGKILIIGATEDDLQEFSPVDCTLQRFDLDGNIDETFGDEGWVIIDSGQSDYCWDVKLTGDSKLVIAGEAHPAADSELRGAFGRAPKVGFAGAGGSWAATNRAMPRDSHFDNIIGRFYLDGTPDASFGEDGLVRFRVNDEPAYAYIFGVDVQPNDKYVVAGEAMSGDFSQMVALRFLGDGPAAQVFAPVVRGGPAGK